MLEIVIFAIREMNIKEYAHPLMLAVAQVVEKVTYWSEG